MKKYFLIPALLVCLKLNAAGDPGRTMDEKMGEFVWNELATPNVQGAKKFYGRVFDWEFIDKNMGDMTYTIIKKGNKEFGGIWAIPAAQQNQIPPHWLAYILVDDIEQSLEKARQNGAALVKPIQQVGDMGLFAILKDPAGAHIALWQSLKK